MTADVDRAAAARDAAVSRVRRATILAGVAGAALMAAFAGLAAASTHARKAVRAKPQPRAHRKRVAAVSAPVPPLVAVPGAGTGEPTQQAPQPPEAPPQPAPQSAPVAVSGGS